MDTTSPAVQEAYSGESSQAKLDAAGAELARLTATLEEASPDNGGGGGGGGSEGHLGGGSSGWISIGNDPIIHEWGLTPTLLSVEDDSDLGDPGDPVLLGYIRLQVTDSFSTARDFTVGNAFQDPDYDPNLQGMVVDPNAGPGYIDTDGHDLAISGVIITHQHLYKEGQGTLSLTGANVWNAAPVVLEGTLQGNTASLDTDIDNDGTVEFLQESDGEYQHVVSGTGALTKSGAGTLTLTSSQTYTGATLVAAGSLVLDTGASLSGQSRTTIQAGASLDLSANADAQLGNLNGAGDLLIGSGETTLNGLTNASFSGDIAGLGTLVVAGYSTQTLLGSNTQAGGTRISGTLAIAGDESLGATGATLTFAGDESTLILLDDLETDRPFLLDIQAEDGSATLDTQAHDLTLTTAISGTAPTLVKQGSGTLTLTTANSFEARVEIDAGTLALAADGSLAAETELSVESGATFDLSGKSGDQSLFALSGGGRVELGSHTLTLGGSTDEYHEFAGVIAGSGGLVKTGENVQILSGTAEYTGTTTLLAGELVVAAGAISSQVVNQATLTFHQSGELDDVAAYSGHIEGSGSVHKIGSGSVWLRGENTYTGGTHVMEGALIGNTDSLPGDIVTDAVLAFYQVENGTYAGNLSGSGALFMFGPGELTLTGTNTHQGGTVSSGVLRVSDDANLGDADGLLVMDGGTLKTLADLDSSRPLWLGEEGGTVDTGNHNVALAGVIQGSGDLTKSGSGTLTLSGSNVFSGTTHVAAGTLALTGSLAGAVDVAGNGTLSGGGSLLGDLGVSGRLAPGASGTRLSVSGRVAFAPGSTFQVTANSSGQNSGLLADEADIAGGEVEVQVSGSNFQTLTRYTLISTQAGVTGQFDDVTDNAAFLDPNLSYDANNVYLTLVRNDQPYSSVASTPVQQEVAGALERIGGDPGDDVASVFAQLDLLSADEAQAAFDNIAANGHPNLFQARNMNQRAVTSQVAGRLALAESGNGGNLNTGLAVGGLKLAFEQRTLSDAPAVYAGAGSAPADGQIHGFWMRGYAGEGQIDAQNGAGKVDLDFHGVLAGYDQALSSQLRLGAMLAYNKPSLDQAAPDYHLDGKGYQISLYGRYRTGPWRIDGLLGYSRENNDTTRGVLGQTARGDFDATALQFHLEAGYALTPAGATGSGLEIEPIISLQASRVREDGYTETGAGVLNLTVPSNTDSGIRSQIGLRLAKNLAPDTSNLRWEGRLAWAHEFQDPGQTSPFLASDPGATPFNVSTSGLPRDSALWSLGLSSDQGKRLRFFAELGGEVSREHHTTSLGFGLHFLW